jgi:bifunctional non-homologous end joining protein LigD
MPLRWSELGRVKAGDAYDLVSARRRMERVKAHPWEAWTKVKQDLDGAMRLIDTIVPKAQGKQRKN